MDYRRTTQFLLSATSNGIAIIFSFFRATLVRCGKMQPIFSIISEVFGDAFISISILLFAIFIPCLILVLGWTKTVSDVVTVLAVANNFQRVCDILLIIIPLGTISYITAFVFGFRGTRTLWPSLFIPCLFLPMLTLFGCQIVLYCFLFLYEEKALPDPEFYWASVAIYLSITCVILLELYMSISKSVARRRQAI
jgi:hypothetical protein